LQKLLHFAQNRRVGIGKTRCRDHNPHDFSFAWVCSGETGGTGGTGPEPTD
jgi:hypothetical protein